MTQPRSHLCERARAWASLRTDGELSELESALLEAHLGHCDPCRTFAVGIEGVATALRSTRLQRPLQRVATPRRSRRAGVRALEVAVAVAVVVSAGALAAFSGPARSSAAGKPVAMVAGVDSPDLLRALRRPALVGEGRLPRNRLVPPEPV
jgi:ferric-dicitrate binding protein FerR (iron transport regulator)